MAALEREARDAERGLWAACGSKEGDSTATPPSSPAGNVMPEPVALLALAVQGNC